MLTGIIRKSTRLTGTIAPGGRGGGPQSYMPIMIDEIIPDDVTISENIGEIMQAPPITLYSAATSPIEMVIYGADGGVGDYDSTTGKYLIPITVRRTNVFDYNNYNLVALYPDQNTGTATASTGTQSTLRSFVIPVTPGKTYCFSARRGVYKRFRLAGYAATPTAGMEGTAPATAKATGDGKYGYAIFTVPSNVTCVLLMMFSDLTEDEIADLVTSEALELLVIESDDVVTYYKSTKTITLEAPVDAAHAAVLPDSLQPDLVSGGNVLTVDTTVQPAAVYIQYNELR